MWHATSSTGGSIRKALQEASSTEIFSRKLHVVTFRGNILISLHRLMLLVCQKAEDISSAETCLRRQITRSGRETSSQGQYNGGPKVIYFAQALLPGAKDLIHLRNNLDFCAGGDFFVWTDKQSNVVIADNAYLFVASVEREAIQKLFKAFSLDAQVNWVASPIGTKAPDSAYLELEDALLK